MPALYTHYKFGQEVFNSITNTRIREVISNNQKMYHLGLCGPDLLFYYGIPTRMKRSHMGFDLHHEIAADFFVCAKKVLLEEQCEKKSAGAAYLFGMVCHYVLDSVCHNSIAYYMEQHSLCHAEMEMDFERYLLLRDGYDPIRHNPVSIYLTKRQTQLVALFYDGVSGRDIAICLQHMRQVTGWLLPSNYIKKGTIHSLLKATGHYKTLKGMIMKDHGSACCEASTQELLECFENAIVIAKELVENYDGYLKGKECLSTRFFRTYGADLNEVALRIQKTD